MPIINSFKRNRPKQEGRRYRAPWYDTTAWRDKRKHQLMTHPLCIHCEQQGIVTAATVCDHKIPVSSYPEDRREHHFWHGEVQSLCDTCHNKKSALERTTRAMDAYGNMIEGNEDI